MTAALTAEGLHTYYGKSHILHGVSLEVAEGKITALLGRNGAGKTTTLRSLMGLTPAREGKITIFGEDTTRWPTFRSPRWAWAMSPKAGVSSPTSASRRTSRFPLNATARGPSRESTSYFRASRSARTTAAGSFRAASRRCCRSAARCAESEALILDEPSQGLAPLIVREVFRIVRR